MAKIGKKTKSVKKKVARLIQDYHDQQRRRDASMAKAADHDLFLCDSSAQRPQNSESRGGPYYRAPRHACKLTPVTTH